MKVNKATPVDLGGIIKMALDHPAPEYDCIFNDYAKFLFWAYNQPKQFLFFVMKEDQNIVGYLILRLNLGVLSRDLSIFDILIKEEFRNKGCIKYFIQTIVKEFINNDVEKLKFSSRILPEKYWKQFIPCKYYTDTIYSVYKEDYIKEGM